MLMGMTSTASADSRPPAEVSRAVPQLTAAGFERLREKIARAEVSLQDARDRVRQQMEAKEAESLGLVEAQQHLSISLESFSFTKRSERGIKYVLARV